jgi:hypothetical protein
MARMKVTPRGRRFRVDVVRDLPRVGPSIVGGPLQTTSETPWVAVVGPHARGPAQRL